MKIIDNLCTLLWIWWPTAHISHPKNTTLVMVSSFLDDPPCHLIFWYFNIKNIYQNLPTTTFALQRALFSTIIMKLPIPNTIKVNFLISGLVSGQGGGKATPPIIRLTPRQWDLPIDSKVQQYYLRFWLSLGEPGKKLHNVWLFVCVRYFPSFPRGWHY